MKLDERQRKILRYIGFVAFYLFCLLIFVRLTFPYETLRGRLLAEFNGSQPDKRLHIDELSGSGLFGVEAEGVRLTEVLTAPSDSSGSPLILAIDELDIGVGPLAYLFGTLSVDFSARLGGGEVEGDFTQSETKARIAVEGTEVDISAINLVGQAIGLPLGGTMSGQLELFLPERQVRKAEGQLSMRIEGLTVGDGKAKIRNTIALPKLQAGDLVIQADATEGRLEVTQFSANGKDFELSADGKVRLREPFDKSSMDLDVGFQFKEAYRTKNDLTKSLFGSPDSKVPALFDMDPQVRQAKQEDGFYRWKVGGLLARPNFRPAAPASSRRP